MVAGSNRMLSDVMSVGVFVHPKKKTDKPEKCRATVEPVSYTHLDVYKRQL